MALTAPHQLLSGQRVSLCTATSPIFAQSKRSKSNLATSQCRARGAPLAPAWQRARTALAPRHSDGVWSQGIAVTTQPSIRATRVVRAIPETTADGKPRLPDQFVPIMSEQELDDILDAAAADGDLVLIDWMATWCRKCIYLKPKIEKLVPSYAKVRFHVVDVNSVSSLLVKRGGVTKMPTIQIYKNREKVEEIIGGEAAWLVLDKIRAAILKHE